MTPDLGLDDLPDQVDDGLRLDVVVWPLISHWGPDYPYDGWHERIAAAQGWVLSPPRLGTYAEERCGPRELPTLIPTLSEGLDKVQSVSRQTSPRSRGWWLGIASGGLVVAGVLAWFTSGPEPATASALLPPIPTPAVVAAAGDDAEPEPELPPTPEPMPEPDPVADPDPPPPKKRPTTRRKSKRKPKKRPLDSPLPFGK